MIQIGATKSGEVCDACTHYYKPNYLTELKIGKNRMCLCEHCFKALGSVINQYKEDSR